MLKLTAMQVQVKTLAETKKLARQLARKLKPGQVLALNGDLGAGKTTFVQELVHSFNAKEIVTSPTFVLLNIYNSPKLKFYHFDFYRLSSLKDIENIGGEELIPPADGVALIEWAEKIPEILPVKHLKIEIKITGEVSRKFTITEKGS